MSSTHFLGTLSTVTQMDFIATHAGDNILTKSPVSMFATISLLRLVARVTTVVTCLAYPRSSFVRHALGLHHSWPGVIVRGSVCCLKISGSTDMHRFLAIAICQLGKTEHRFTGSQTRKIRIKVR